MEEDKEKEIVFNQETEVDSKFNEELFIEGLKSQLGSIIFKELINEEKEGLIIKLIIEVKG